MVLMLLMLFLKSILILKYPLLMEGNEQIKSEDEIGFLSVLKKGVIEVPVP